jgi:hypothetical protein
MSVWWVIEGGQGPCPQQLHCFLCSSDLYIYIKVNLSFMNTSTHPTVMSIKIYKVDQKKCIAVNEDVV